MLCSLEDWETASLVSLLVLYLHVAAKQTNHPWCFNYYCLNDLLIILLFFTQPEFPAGWRVDPGAIHFNRSEPIGKGSYGSVYEARFTPPGATDYITVVAKRIHRLKNENPFHFHERVEDEVRVMKLADRSQTYVVKCYGCFYSEPEDQRRTAVIIMERMPYDVRSYLDQKSMRGEMPMELRLKVFSCHHLIKIVGFNVFCCKICRNTLRALKYCHTVLGVVHNDIKCNNVLLADHGEVVKFCDFGCVTNGPSSKFPNIFSGPCRTLRKPFRPVQQDITHYWCTTYTGTRLSGWDVDFFSFVQFCVTVLFHDDPMFLQYVRNNKQFPPRVQCEMKATNHPFLRNFFAVGQKYLEERDGVFGREWDDVGGLLMDALGGKF